MYLAPQTLKPCYGPAGVWACSQKGGRRKVFVF